MTTNQTEVSIRPAIPTDAAALLELLKQLQTESSTFEVANNLNELTIAKETHQIELIQATTTNIILVAALDDQLIGVATAIERNDHSNTSELGVAVLKEFYNNGLGTALVDELIYWAESYSTLDKLVLTVLNNNTAAIKIYEKLGFEDNDIQPDIVTNLRAMTYDLAPLIG
ncbi:GNAT family N-acetyltransferase [Periweissella fabalis]|uniref:GNAT family N-acetyltransferase n=1 Tax=Periweissella fabalis TaxID=1070421 RepID=A0A7X6N237_9LACO|nr:GNAT family N-acetyltransferase [Periweissella fabalis]MCM0598693.1 GNAT family N-acetyltransferase [Periweissella fabalis]NKZ24346.1 GNAT family N-acetyltransferase [Periweissella fabalis]